MLGVALEGLAAAAGAESERTGRLLGSAEAIRAATGTELDAAESLVHERTIALLRDSATAAEIDASLTAGSRRARRQSRSGSHSRARGGVS